MYKQMFALTRRLEAQYFIDLKVLWATAVLGAAKGRGEQARETLKIERLRAGGLRVDNV